MGAAEKTQFTIICNEPKYLTQVIEYYNSVYKTDFKIKEHLLDEVNFATIEVSHCQLSDIFNLGFLFGVKEEKLRNEGKIDW